MSNEHDPLASDTRVYMDRELFESLRDRAERADKAEDARDEAQVQLAICLIAAEGEETAGVSEGEFGYSLPLARIRDVRRRLDDALDLAENVAAERDEAVGELRQANRDVRELIERAKKAEAEIERCDLRFREMVKAKRLAREDEQVANVRNIHLERLVDELVVALEPALRAFPVERPEWRRAQDVYLKALHRPLR